MKNLYLLGGMLFCLLHQEVNAQPRFPIQQTLPSRPSLFTGIPDKCAFSNPAIQKIFSSSTGVNVRIPLENNSFLEGYILEKVKRADNIITLNIRITNYDNALFTITQVTDKEQKEYTGRIVHPAYGDVLLVVQDKEQLYFTKEKRSAFMVE
jgi:hypothetical protein